MSQPNHTNNTREFNAKDQEYCHDCDQEIELCECGKDQQDMDDIIGEYGCDHLDECDCFNSMVSDFVEARARVKELEKENELLKEGKKCDHKFHYFGDQKVRRCNLCNELEKDPNKCPKCGGEPDNGFDRCIPPNPYHCTRCEQ